MLFCKFICGGISVIFGLFYLFILSGVSSFLATVPLFQLGSKALPGLFSQVSGLTSESVV